MALRCKRCGSGEHTRNGLMRGRQRYRCKACGLNVTATPPRGKPPAGKPPALKVTAVLPYLSGLSMNRTAKLSGVSTPSVMAWIERFARDHAQQPGPRGRAVAIEPDGVRHHLKKKPRKLRVRKARDRASRRLVDWECGGRDRATLKRLLETA